MEVRRGLPVGAAAFVGREQERATVTGLVTEAPVVTLTGSGGCGKTRLAVEVVGDVASQFADGACWVDLQAVSEPELVVTALAEAVDVHERPARTLPAILAEQLHSRHLLVVLDNCEHLVGACAELVGGLSSACPRLHVLATSRVPLMIQEETTVEVSGLPVPDRDHASASTVAAAAAARLFEVRARQVVAGFRIGDDNASAVTEICRRLDGIPLAIELAAARIRVLAPNQIAHGLSDRFGLLTGGTRGSSPRQRTLEASLDWSYQLLGHAQRLALVRLSVFVGSFELDAAVAVAGGKGIEDDAVLDLVAGLVEQSMIQVVERQGSARYRLLETIRVYARQRLPELDDPERVRRRHLEFHVSLAERAHVGLTGGQPGPWVERLAEDLDDLRAAMQWATGQSDLTALVDLTEPVVRFWFDRSLSPGLHQRLHEAGDAPGASEDERVRALLAASALAVAGSEPVSAHRTASRAVDVARSSGTGGALAVGLSLRAFTGVLSGLSTSEQVDSDVGEALRRAEGAEDASTHAYVLAFSGAALSHHRSLDAGRRLFERAVEVCEDNELVFQLPAAHAAMGAGLGPGPEWSGRLTLSRHHARRAVELSRRVGRPGWETAGLTGLGAADVLQGHLGSAREWLSLAQEVVRSRALEGSQWDLALRHWLALSAYVSGDPGTARTTAAAIVRTARDGGSRRDESVGEWLLGLLAHGDGRQEDARTHLETSRALATSPCLPWPLGRSLLGLAALAEEDEHVEEAWQLAHDALEVLDDYGDRVGAAAALEQVADLAQVLGEAGRALRLLAAAQRFRTDTGITRFPDEADRLDRVRTSARAALGADADECWDAGGALSLAEAISYGRRGRGERQRPRLGWAALTPVERDVVRLVAEGFSNADIGRRLFISVNTVKKHLSHVYTKVDVDGRTDLAAQAARRDV